MRIIHNLDEMTETARGWLAAGSVGFIPTMGYLHAGHIALVNAAQKECEISVVSIFVNPLQFEQSEDLARYPRDLARDLQLLNATNIDVVFIPDVDVLFPPNFSTYVIPSSPAGRPKGIRNVGYIRGVATVTTKLFQLVRPDVAYLGQKDAHRVAVVRQVVRDLNFDVNLRILPTVRESDGLALSSSNHLLTPPERQAASMLYRALLIGKALIDGGERNAPVVEKAMTAHLQAESLIKLDYVTVCHPDTFRELDEVRPGTLLALSARIGNVPLIDNIIWNGGSWLL